MCMFFTYLYVCAPSVYSTSEGHKRVLDALEEQPCTQVRHVSECTFLFVLMTELKTELLALLF